MLPVLGFIDYVIYLYSIVVFVYIILGWLQIANVINPRNQYVHIIYDAMARLVEPALAFIRRFLPNRGIAGAIDLTPVALLLAIFFVRSVVISGWLAPLLS